MPCDVRGEHARIVALVEYVACDDQVEAPAECLRVAPKVEVRPRVRLRLEAPFALTGAVYPVLDAAGVERLQEAFTATGMVIELSVDAGALAAFRAALRDATRGKAVLTEL